MYSTGFEPRQKKKKKLKKKTKGHEGIRTRVRNWKLIFVTPRFAELEVNLCTSQLVERDVMNLLVPSVLSFLYLLLVSSDRSKRIRRYRSKLYRKRLSRRFAGWMVRFRVDLQCFYSVVSLYVVVVDRW